MLRARGWEVEPMHGNLYQHGVPDRFVMHNRWGTRWIDYKVAGRYSFTRAQRLKWPRWDAKGVGVWIITAASEAEYKKLFEPANWRAYWRASYGEPVSIDKLLDELENE